jgi:hypothetical protein
MNTEQLTRIVELQQELLSQHRRYSEEQLELVRRQVANQDKIVKSQRVFLRVGLVVLTLWFVVQLVLFTVTD